MELGDPARLVAFHRSWEAWKFSCCVYEGPEFATALGLSGSSAFPVLLASVTGAAEGPEFVTSSGSSASPASATGASWPSGVGSIVHRATGANAKPTLADAATLITRASVATDGTGGVGLAIRGRPGGSKASEQCYSDE